MAFNPAPTALFSSYASDGTTISIDIADFDGLTAAEANATTGDWRQIVLAFMSTLYTHYASLATADKPVALVTPAPSQFPVSSGDLAGTFKTTYSVVFYNSYTSANVADEPT